MSEVKELKGYLQIEGRIVGLNNKKIKEAPKSRELSFGVLTRKDNMVYVRVFGFKKEAKDEILVEYTDENKKHQSEKALYEDRFFLKEGRSIVGTKIKRTVDGETESVVDVDAVQIVKDTFKDGQTVVINLASEPDTYYKNLKFNVKKIFISSKEIDFEKEVEEQNHGRQWIVFNEIVNNEINGFVFNKKDESVSINMRFSEYITLDDFKDFKQGDIIQLDYEYNKVPIYTGKIITKEKTNTNYKAKGKYASEDKDNGYSASYPEISGYEEFLVCVGIKNVNSEATKDISSWIQTLNADEEEPF